MNARTAATAVLACGVMLLGQQSAAPQDALPTFRTGVEAIQIDAIVTDADGRPVKDLTADEFVILENGTPRPVTAFGLVDIPIERPHGPVTQWTVPPDVLTNEGPEGRLYLIALDEVAQENAVRTRVFLRRFLEEHFQPHDVAAVVLTGRGLVTDGQPFTSDPRLILDAVDKFSGGFREGTSTPECDDGPQAFAVPGIPMPRSNTRDMTVRNRLERLRALTELLAPIPGGRKTLLYFTQCIRFDMFDALDYSGGVLGLAAEQAHAAMVAATRGNVVVYPIDPAGLTLEGGLQKLQDRADLASLAAATGGFSLANSNSFMEAFDRVVQEASSYYVLGFSSAYTRRDGRYVRLDVRVTRPGLRVRARDGYLAPMGATRRAAEPTAPPSAMSVALARPLATRDVPIRVFAAPYKGPGREATVALALEIDAGAVEAFEQDGSHRRTLEVTYTAADARNRVYPGAAHAIALTGPASSPATGQWLRILTQLELPAGQYQVRVAAGGAARAGSVVYDLEVPDFTRDALMLSGITLTSASARAVQTLRPAPGSGGRSAAGCRPPSCVVPLATDGAPAADDPLRDALPGPPTTARAFDRSDTLVLFTEVYENRRQAAGQTIEVTTSLRREDGEILVAVSEPRPSTAPRRASGGHGFTAQLTLQDVPPGRYLLQVDARSDAGDAAASRAVPITVR